MSVNVVMVINFFIFSWLVKLRMKYNVRYPWEIDVAVGDELRVAVAPGMDQTSVVEEQCGDVVSQDRVIVGVSENE